MCRSFVGATADCAVSRPMTNHCRAAAARSFLGTRNREAGSCHVRVAQQSAGGGREPPLYCRMKLKGMPSLRKFNLTAIRLSQQHTSIVLIFTVPKSVLLRQVSHKHQPHCSNGADTLRSFAIRAERTLGSLDHTIVSLLQTPTFITRTHHNHL